jgi:hypothetical protein
MKSLFLVIKLVFLTSKMIYVGSAEKLFIATEWLNMNNTQ